MSRIITTDDLTSYKNTTLVPAIAKQVVDAINAWVESRTHRCFGEQRTVIERYDWGRGINLRHQDVDTTSLIIKTGYPNSTQTTMDASGYFANSFGRVTLYWRGFGTTPSQSFLYNDYVEVTYKHGSIAVPEELKLAALGIASKFYNYAINNQQDVVASSVGNYRLQFAGSVRGSSGDGGSSDPAKRTDDANWAIVDSFRMQRL